MESLFTRIECRNPLLHLLGFFGYYEIKDLVLINKYLKDKIERDSEFIKMMELKRQRLETKAMEFHSRIYSFNWRRYMLLFYKFPKVDVESIFMIMEWEREMFKERHVCESFLFSLIGLGHDNLTQRINVILKYMEKKRYKILTSSRIFEAIYQQNNIEALLLILKYPYLNKCAYEIEGTMQPAVDCKRVDMYKILLNDGRFSPTYRKNEMLECAVISEDIPLVKLLLRDKRVRRKISWRDWDRYKGYADNPKK